MNGDVLRELKEIEKHEDMPPKVSNRLILAAVIQLYDILHEGKFDKRISRNETMLKIGVGLLTAILGWTVFGG